MILAAACGQDATPPPAPTSTAVPTIAATSTPATNPTTPPSPTPTPTPTLAPAPTAAATVAAPPTPTPVAAADPFDAYFDLNRVLDIEIEIALGDWETLRHQTRTFEGVMAEIEEHGLSRPFASIYTWFSGTVTVDGETHRNVGVRKKGFLGSQSDTKPSLKLRFDKYVDGQSLGGVIERMTLNNSIQDASMVNTCLAYQIFEAAGLPSSRCNFATVTVNGTELGLYVHVEEIKRPFLALHFGSGEGNLYEGTVSDFSADFRGTLEKKTNEIADDWSDIDAVVDALSDPSDAGLEALAQGVDLDRFLSFWATEVLVGHWDGYSGNRNNYQFYREPDGRFVFIPWGVDDTFHLKDDPNPFDNISDPPPSVLALSAIPNRLYNDAEWRSKYVVRLKELLDTVWKEDELLKSVDEMAAIVQQHALPETRASAAHETARVQKFILKRRGEILADITPEPPDWPEAQLADSTVESGTLELSFETTWGSNMSSNPLEEGAVTGLLLSEGKESSEGMAVVAGHASPEEQAILPGVGKLASIAIFGVYPDGTVRGVTVVLPLSRLTGGARLVIGEDVIAGGVWTIPPGATLPDRFSPLTAGTLVLSEGGTEQGATIVGSFGGSFGSGDSPSELSEGWEFGELEVRFTTTWGSNESLNLSTEAELPFLSLNGVEQPSEDIVVIAGHAGPDESRLLPGKGKLASLAVIAVQTDGSANGLTVVLPLSQLTGGLTLVIGEDEIAGGVWTLAPGAAAPDSFSPFTTGTLELSVAATEPGATIVGSFFGFFGEILTHPERSEGSVVSVTANPGLVINEVAAKGDPLDWFELYNSSSEAVALAGFLVADDLKETAKRVAFPSELVVLPGEYMRIELDKDGWPGFALGGDEELGVWTADGILVDEVNWDQGQAGEGESFARVPDAIGEFRTVGDPTPGAKNEAAN